MHRNSYLGWIKLENIIHTIPNITIVDQLANISTCLPSVQFFLDREFKDGLIAQITHYLSVLAYENVI